MLSQPHDLSGDTGPAAPRDWSPDSWRSRQVAQAPKYPDAGALERAEKLLATLPPLVTSWEILALKQQIAEAQEGRRFLLQGGDCAESFCDCDANVISNRLKVLLQMSLVLVHGLRLPVIRVGRFAGQYAKPRSADAETRDGVTLPCYRGDVVNGDTFTAEARTPDPQRMVEAHFRSSLTMNFVRALVDGGFADLRHPEYWELGWMAQSPLAGEYRRMVDAVGDAVRFMEAISGESIQSLSRAEFYTSHEALLLPYEQAVTRGVPHHAGYFNLSTHLPWVGLRTTTLDGAHIEYVRGLQNPLALKVGPATTPDELIRLLERLNPANEPGRIALIQRLGANRIAEVAPAQIAAVQREGQRVLWVCDPMHGNTETTSNGFKTRRFSNIHRELELSFEIHAAAGSRVGGVHLELTGENVTECLGGARELVEADLERAYRSTVDPRLNDEQSLELAMLIVRKHAQIAALK